MPQSKTQTSSWWPTIFAIILLIIIAVLAAFSYQSYAHNVELAALNTDLHNQVQTVTSDKTTLTGQVTDLTKQIAQLKCAGMWTGESCVTPTVTIKSEPSSGPSPLAIELKVHAKSAEYAVSFGDGASGTISGGACSQETDGLCTFALKHTYKLVGGKDSQYIVQVKQGATAVASTTVSVSAK